MNSKTFSEQQTKYLSNWKGLNMTTMFSYIFPNPCWENIRQNRKKCFPSRHPEKRRHKKWYKHFSWNECTWCDCSACKFVRAFRYFRPAVIDVKNGDSQVMMFCRGQHPGFVVQNKRTYQRASDKFENREWNRKKNVLKWRHEKSIFCVVFFSWNKQYMLLKDSSNDFWLKLCPKWPFWRSPVPG